MKIEREEGTKLCECRHEENHEFFKETLSKIFNYFTSSTVGEFQC
jgi:hypothetical protein